MKKQMKERPGTKWLLMSSALVFCAPQAVDLSVINGRVVVEDGQLLTLDLVPAIERHNRIAREMVLGA